MSGRYYLTAEPVGVCSCHACTCPGCHGACGGTGESDPWGAISTEEIA